MDVKFFKNQMAFHKWLEKNHAIEKEIWVGFYKKSSEKTGVTYAEALDEALCFGWIDGIRKAIDEISYCNRFTPRKASSNWSKINTEKVKLLTELGLMKEAGLKAVEEAKGDGRWDKAYESSKNTVIPEDFLKELNKNKKASAFYKTLNKQNIFSITYRLQNSKKIETRQRWIKKIIEMLSKGESFHL